MADVNDARGAEQQRPQGQIDSNFYANNNLDVRIAPQQWQADANARAQQHVPSFDLQPSDTRSGADKYAPQQNTALLQDRNRTNTLGGRKPDTAPRPESAGDKIDTSDLKWGNNNKANNKLSEKSGEAESKARPQDEVDPNTQKEEMEKLPADATSPDGQEHIDKLPADAPEDQSAGSYHGGSSESSHSSQRSDSDNSRAGQRSGLEQEQERARTAYEAITGSSAPRVFNSIGEAMSEGQRTASRS